MKRRYKYWLGSLSIKDNETGEIFDEVVDLLNEQNEKIENLEKELNDKKQQLFELLQLTVDSDKYHKDLSDLKKLYDWLYNNYIDAKQEISELEKELKKLQPKTNRKI